MWSYSPCLERSCLTLERPFRTPTSRSSRTLPHMLIPRPGLCRGQISNTFQMASNSPPTSYDSYRKRQCSLLKTLNFPPATSALSPRIEMRTPRLPNEALPPFCRFQPAHQHQLSKWPTLFSSADSDIWPAWFLFFWFLLTALALAARLNSWNFLNCNEHASGGGRLWAVSTKIEDFGIFSQRSRPSAPPYPSFTPHWATS